MAPASNAKNSVTSTWALAHKSTWNIYQRLIHLLDLHPVIPGKPVPVHAKTEKVPYMSQWSQHIWILTYAAIPLAIHQAWVTRTGLPLNVFYAFNLYNLAFTLIAVRETRVLRGLAYKYGFLDGDVAERDGIPDTAAGKIIGEMFKTAGFRLAMSILLTYNADVSPADLMSDWRWWVSLLAKLSLYGVILDFWFYSYHRAMHEIPWLWKFHRTHHLTKHPNALLSAYADDEQEVIEMVVVPFLAYGVLWAIGLPLGFYDWWICYQYIAFAEVWGHSGVRVHGFPPSPISWLYNLLGVELVLEDHDLHHRQGWRKSFNYGKQTRVWDRIFGTCRDRIESVSHNIDYTNRARMPLF